jgi:hypothetical protein
VRFESQQSGGSKGVVEKALLTSRSGVDPDGALRADGRLDLAGDPLDAVEPEPCGRLFRPGS